MYSKGFNKQLNRYMDEEKDFFCSPQHQVIYYLMEGDFKKLGIKYTCFMDRDYANEWRDTIYNILNFDKSIPEEIRNRALNKVELMYNTMIEE